MHPNRNRPSILYSGLAGISLCLQLNAAPVDATDVVSLEHRFTHQILPFINTYCIDCHGEDRPKAKFSLSSFKTLSDVTEGHQHWDLIMDRLTEEEMPPEEADQFPSNDETAEFISWYQQVREREARKNAGDPGTVLARRLSNAEYNYSIRDLTGVDIKPTRDFPIDAANQAGFDNSGESLTLTPGLLNKYLQAARKVTEHLVLTPSGLTWSPHPCVTVPDRDKYAVRRIIDFYQRQATDLADYFYAAWKHSQADDSPTLEQTAGQVGVSPKYLRRLWVFLNTPQDQVGPVRTVIARWNELSEAQNDEDARAASRSLRDYIKTVRRQIEPTIENLEGGSIHRGSQPYVLWKNRQYQSNRRQYDSAALMTPSAIAQRIEESKQAIQEAKEKKARNRDSLREFRSPHTDLILPDAPDTHSRIHQSVALFADLFPDAFLISERGRDYVGKRREDQEKGRLLSAGFHSMMGYFRDDQPLYDLILNPDAQREIDRLWDELDFITKAPKRQYIGFLWFERTDSRYMTDEVFDFARPEHTDATDESKIKALAKVYLEKAERQGAGLTSLTAVEHYFDQINQRIRWLEQTEINAQARHLRDLLDTAHRAYRRPLTDNEKQSLLDFYESLRTQSGFTHEEALRDTFTSVLVSPHFFFRLPPRAETTEQPIAPLSDLALASRLSYFLWSSLPDEALLQAAQRGELQDRNEFARHAKRMIRDPRIRALAVEFGANWLDFRRFDTHNAVDRNRFPQFNDELRQAMFEEPIRFLVDLMQHDRPLHSILYGTHTFANRPLAEHYGFSSHDLKPNEWARFDQAHEHTRGGLMPMAAFLTMNAPGLRTSPVKRGYWVARRILGETIPPPPPDVPEIPSDEAGLGSLTLPEILAKHREHPNCAACHERFDSLGLVFENFGPIGESRTLDMGQRPISTAATFPDGSQGSGLDGLKEYIRTEREPEFYRNFCTKLLTFALGRSLLLSDEPLIERMLAKLKETDYSFTVAVEVIVTSRQFMNQRVEPSIAKN